MFLQLFLYLTNFFNIYIYFRITGINHKKFGIPFHILKHRQQFWDELFYRYSEQV